jgi:signal transduction histidine kinase
MDAAPRPPLLKRVPPGGWLTISWCAVIAYVGGPVMLFVPGRPLWHQVLFGVPMLIWAGLVVALSAVLLRRWPLPALGLLLVAAIATASAPHTAQSIASFLVAPAGAAVGFIAATASRRVSVAAAVIALGVLVRYGTNWQGQGLRADCWPAAVVFAWLIGHSIRQHRLHADTESAQTQAGAVTAERLHIAGELHDMVAHAIGVITTQAGAGSRVIDTETAEARNALIAIEATSRQTLAGVRQALGALRRAERSYEPGLATPGPVRTGAPPPPPLRRRVPPGVWIAVSWCAVTAYVISAAALNERRHLPALTTRGPRLAPEGMPALPLVVLATAGVVALSVALLRRWPLSALGLLLVGAIAAEMAPEPVNPNFYQLVLQPPAFFLIAPAAVAVGFIAATRPRPVSVGAAVIALGVLARYAGRAMPPAGFSPSTSPVLPIAVAIVIAWLIGQSIRQNRQHAQTLRTAAQAEAVTAERLRIARELHDMIAHSIGVIAIQAGAGSQVIETQPAEARNALIAIEATSRQALADLRSALGAPSAAGTGPDLARSPLDPAPGLAGIAQLAETAMRAGVRVDVHWRGDRRPLPAGIDQSAFRIIQEAVTNVVRHAGTSTCRVIIDQHHDEVALEVVDDGRGGSPDGAGYGIVGMRERADLLGGQLSAGPRPEGGFRVAARLPLPVPAGA